MGKDDLKKCIEFCHDTDDMFAFDINTKKAGHQVPIAEGDKPLPEAQIFLTPRAEERRH